MPFGKTYRRIISVITAAAVVLYFMPQPLRAEASSKKAGSANSAVEQSKVSYSRHDLFYGYSVSYTMGSSSGKGINYTLHNPRRSPRSLNLCVTIASSGYDMCRSYYSEVSSMRGFEYDAIITGGLTLILAASVAVCAVLVFGAAVLPAVLVSVLFSAAGTAGVIYFLQMACSEVNMADKAYSEIIGY